MFMFIKLTASDSYWTAVRVWISFPKGFSDPRVLGSLQHWQGFLNAVAAARKKPAGVVLTCGRDGCVRPALYQMNHAAML